MQAPLSTDETEIARTARYALIDDLKQRGVIKTQRVEAAFRAVPRHLFLPSSPLDEVYKDKGIVTKIIGDQSDPYSYLSSSTQPSLMAQMLEMLDVQPGQRILEIGAGTGYNAALLAHLVGPTGHITTIDLDQDIVDSAWAHLEAAGFQHVQVICGDGYSGYREYAPYDRIVVTAATQDIAAAWWDQLMDGGRLVVPLAIPPLYVQHVFPWKALIAFNKHGDVMVSDAFGNCNFMPLRGASSSMPTPGMALNEQVRLTADERQIDHDALVVALKGPRRDVVTHVNVSLPDMAGLGLWLTLRDPNVCLLYMNGPMVEPYLGLDLINGTRITLGPNSGDGIPITFGSMCMTSVSLLVPRQASLDDTSVQLVVQSFGPDETLAQRLIEHICAWDHAGRPFKYGRFEPARTPLQIYAYPLSKQYSPATNELSVQKAWTHLVFSFGI